MKKIVVLTVLLALVGTLAFSQIRIDAGIAVPIGIGAVLDGSSLEMNGTVGEFLSRTFLPLPEAALHYQFDLGNIKMGIGARAFTLILETMVWPNAFVEYDFGPIVAEAQVGGGAFLLLGLVSDFQTGEVFFPDLSVWMKLGATQGFRLGAGVIGIYLPEQSSTFPVVVYLSGKIALVSD
jgi:hypothetical protein